MSAPPFDAAHLDRLMDEAGIDVLLATSKHNVQYLLGGHRALFFDYMDAIGVSRYLPAFVYPKGQPDRAAYIGHRIEGHQVQVAPLWPNTVQTKSWGATDSIEKAMAHVHGQGLSSGRIGVEMAFLPAISAETLRAAAPNAMVIDAAPMLDRLRACKSEHELSLLREASERVIDSMLAVLAAHGPGSTKREMAEALRREETDRGMQFEYCLIAAGKSHNRAPSDHRWEKGDVLSLDSGGNYRGYIGDIARMAILGSPDAELEDALAEIETVQRAAFAPVRPGVLGGEIYAGAEAALKKCKFKPIEFVAHGMGLATHEVPHLTSRGPTPYPDDDARRPLEPGMVLSVETTLMHPKRGFIKLEDTVAVTRAGFEVFADRARGWNRGADVAARPAA
jgi:Xaa-Pro aminopeptidase